MKKLIVLVVCIFIIHVKSFSAVVDTIIIPSKVMNKEYKAVIVLPASYASNNKSYPVLYLLHGGYGHFDDWIKKTQDTTLIQKLSDQYNFIVVMPEGEIFSYYLNSPVKKESQFETYITHEVIEKIDDGTEDFLIEANRELHRRLVFNGTPHDYSERPGSHTWAYWQNSLPYHALFFSKVFKENGSAIN